MDEILLQASKFRVVKRTVDTGRGEPVAKELVLRQGAAMVLPITDEEGVVMVKNFRWAIGRELLELPAGTLEPLEDPKRCAARELEEETGFSAGTLRPLCRFYTTPGFCNELMHAYVASDLQAGDQRLSADEKISVEILSFDQINDAIRSGRIIDAKSLAVLLYYQMMERA